MSIDRDGVPRSERIEDSFEKARAMAEAEDKTREEISDLKREGVQAGFGRMIRDSVKEAGIKYEIDKINIGERTDEELASILHAIQEESDRRRRAFYAKQKAEDIAEDIKDKLS